MKTEVGSFVQARFGEIVFTRNGKQIRFWFVALYVFVESKMPYPYLAHIMSCRPHASQNAGPGIVGLGVAVEVATTSRVVVAVAITVVVVKTVATPVTLMTSIGGAVSADCCHGFLNW